MMPSFYASSVHIARLGCNPLSASFEDCLNFAHLLANEAGKVILPHFRNLKATNHKGGALYDPVTLADQEAERVIRDCVTREFPDHGIIGEEFPPHNETAEFVWTVDPIDGTRAFIMGLPIWGTLLGLGQSGRPLLGLMDQPYTGERFWSDRDAAWFRGARGELRRCEVRPCESLGDAILTSTTPDMFADAEFACFDKLAKAVRMRRYGGDCYAYAMLALGQIDLVVEAALKPFDIAPLIPIIEKAGGVITGWNGEDAAQGGRVVAAGDPRLHEKALSILRECPPAA